MELVIGRKLNRKGLDEGVWHQMGSQRLLLAAYRNKTHIEEEGRLLREYEAKHGKPAEDNEDAMLKFEAFLRCVVLDFKGLKNADGEDVEYSPEVLLADIASDPDDVLPLYLQWYKELVEFTVDVQNYIERRVKKTAKKSPRRKRGAKKSTRKSSST